MKKPPEFGWDLTDGRLARKRASARLNVAVLVIALVLVALPVGYGLQQRAQVAATDDRVDELTIQAATLEGRLQQLSAIGDVSRDDIQAHSAERAALLQSILAGRPDFTAVYDEALSLRGAATLTALAFVPTPPPTPGAAPATPEPTEQGSPVPDEGEEQGSAAGEDEPEELPVIGSLQLSGSAPTASDVLAFFNTLSSSPTFGEVPAQFSCAAASTSCSFTLTVEVFGEPASPRLGSIEQQLGVPLDSLTEAAPQEAPADE